MTKKLYDFYDLLQMDCVNGSSRLDNEINLLTEAFRETMQEVAKKTKDDSYTSESNWPLSHLTTFAPFDYKNGSRVTIDVNNGLGFNYDSLGLGQGSQVMIIGLSGSAKTAAAIEMGSSIIAPYPCGSMLIEDPEKGTDKNRIRALTGWNTAMIERKIIHRQKGINSESFFKRVTEFCLNKQRLAIKYPEHFTYFTGTINSKGEPVYALIPSVVILDSLALLAPEGELDEEEGKLNGNMSAAAIAKVNKQVYVRLNQLLAKTNTILITINHINKNININPFVKSQAQINYLGQDELLPGGTAPLYLANNIIRTVTSTKLTDDKNPYGDFTGWISKFKIIKSRSNRAGQECELVYNQVYGYDRQLSIYHTLKAEGFIKGSIKYYVDGLPSIKFSQKDFKQTLMDNDILKEAVLEAMKYCGQTYLSGNDKINKETKEIGENYFEDYLEGIKAEMLCA